MDAQNESRPLAEREKPTPPISLLELTAIIASLMALNALAIDIMLPALPDMQAHFGLTDDNERQKVIIAFILGLGLSQLFYGPLMDRFGRKPVLGWALTAYVAAGAYCAFAQDYDQLVGTRFVQGCAAGASRVVAAAVVRDFFSGRRMAEFMSLVMLIFMAAPILAPSLGQAVLLLFHDWIAPFWALVVYGAVIGVWAMIRLPETLKPEDRTPLRPSSIYNSYRTVFTTRVAIGYMAASALIFSSLFSYVSASEQIFGDVFDIHASFPLWFAGIAACMGVSNLINSRIVQRFGMRRLSHTALIAMALINVAHAFMAATSVYSFPVFYLLMMLSFLCIGFIGPNFSAMAMEPLGRIAGVSAALYGFATTFGSGLIGGWVAGTFDGTTAPVFAGNAGALVIAIGFVLVAERGRLFVQRSA